MDSDFVTGRAVTGSRRRGLALILIGMIAALSLVIAASAQAAPNAAVAWGWNEHGQLGDGTSEGPEKCGPSQEACSTTPVAVSELSGVTAVAGGETHSLGLLENGTVMAWGANSAGQLGNGTTTASDVPVAVSGLSGVTAIAAGSGYSLALLENGTVMAWGNNSSGQLGNGTTTKSTVPVAVSGLSEVDAIAAGQSHALALLSSGAVESWGGNGSGQLGNGSTTKSTVPVSVSGLSGVTGIAAGGNHSLALLGSGTVMAWGENADGELGDGTTTNSNVPVAVSELSGVAAIAAGGNHNLALLSGGTVKSWGSNEKGQLGNGTSSGPETCGLNTPCSKKPVAVSGLSGVSAVAAGGEQFSLALLSSGSVMAWGDNGQGELGDGTSTGPEPCGLGSCSTTPVAVSTQGVEVGISAGAKHGLAFGPPPPSETGLPELGRCVKVAGKGAYKYNGCVIPAPGHTGNFEWEPGPGEKPGFEANSQEAILQTVGGTRISCGPSEVAGSWTGAKTATVTLTLRGCSNLSTKKLCQSNPSQQSEISGTAEGELGFISTGGTKPKVGLDLKPKSPSTSILSFTCGGPPGEIGGEAWSVEGSVIGEIKPIDRMKLEYKLVYAARNGKQIPERFEGGLKDTLITSRFTGPEQPKVEQAGLTLREERKTILAEGEEPLEIKAK
jgi:alpha-tubulin suppressor-like RCC1 family protein